MRPPLKPPARARRMRVLETRARGPVLTAQAIDELFRSADVMVEGSLSEKGGDATFFGSMMITFLLDRLVEHGREEGRRLDGEEALERLASAIAGSVRVRIRAHRMARAQVYERFPDRSVGTVVVETRFSRTGARLYVDIDLEAPVEVASTARRAR